MFVVTRQNWLVPLNMPAFEVYSSCSSIQQRAQSLPVTFKLNCYWSVNKERHVEKKIALWVLFLSPGSIYGYFKVTNLTQGPIGINIECQK
ncbi:hypothetical protein BY458DRAFT_504746 [Sporodiniella umbellata]|nr:hypothetical protein BY458DRAFT_504746 [Sporodiniella umbellata]